ncbi:TonB-dependent receptor [Altererythrobacter indicus]|uniref:TonB-dependent receptor n=1 Tax=Altericroceibacterium indicum TaxID=374177 RepID=A0A845A790_9SPHN|nr:TonB-dependent receptor [Altericroceibacterium indicum]MXP26242.1 TonB-dependent receptor [Altericroceibacterium indicum]
MKTIFTRDSKSAKFLLAGASSFIALAIANPASAAEESADDWSLSASNQQTNDTSDSSQNDSALAKRNDSDDIVVVGIRGSLQRNLDAKRAAPGVVDVISSEDIGKFPDNNVAASLQRLPGISISRNGPRGEATGVTVRGFGGDFNTTLVDGRRLSTATGGRSIDFSTVGSDFLGSLTVLKTPDVMLTSSSIGATINIEYPKPFDRPGLQLAASASGSIQDKAGKVVPTGGLLFSNTFADDTFGILVDAIYTRRDTQTNNVFNHGFPGGRYAPCQLAGSTATSCNPVNPETNPDAADSDKQTVVGFFSQQYGAQQLYSRDERVDGRIALQWRPSDAVEITLDNNYSNQKIRGDSVGVGIWFNQGGLRNVVLDENGTTVDFTQSGSQTDFTAETTQSYQRTNMTGLNIKWDVSDNFKVEADGAYSQSWLNPDGRLSNIGADVGYGFAIGPALGVAINGDSSDAIPQLHDYGPNGNAADWANPDFIGSHVTVNQAQKNKDTVKQARLAATWEQEGLTLRFGGSYLEDHYKFQASNTFTNNFWQAYSGYGPASGTSGGVAIPADLFKGTISTDGFIPGFSGSLPPVLLDFTAQDYQAFLTALGNPQAQNIPGYGYGCCNGDFTGTFDVAIDPGSVRDIQEKTWALYMRANFETEIADMPFYFNAGLRQEVTHLSSTGIGRLPIGLTRSDTDPTLLTVAFSESQDVTTKSDYSYLLPSVDMKLLLSDSLHLRFDASRTLTRPGLDLLSPALNIGSGQRVGALTADGGNPNLKPYLADNFDFAVEWYYQPNSYASANVFIKNVSNFVVQGTQRQTINDVIDPSTGQPAQFTVSQRVNGPDATVKGIELAWQHVFGDSGFGFNANATFVETNKPYDPDDISQSGFAVTGLANSANFVGFFDKYGFQARVAVNWRDEYLSAFGQLQNTSAFGAEPTFVDANTQVDVTTSYQLTEGISVFADVQNVTNATQSTHGRYSNQLLDVYAYGRRYSAGVRARF